MAIAEVQSQSSTPSRDPENEVTVSPIPQGDIKTPLMFAKLPESGEQAYMYIKKAPPPGVPFTNVRPIPMMVHLHDLRGKESCVNLDDDSLEVLLKVPRPVSTNFDDEESIKRTYYPEVERQLRRVIPNASKIHIFRHGIRHTKNNPKPYNPPALIAHVDHTPTSVVQRIKRHLPDEADSLLKGRYRLIHFWQSLAGPVYDTPLAIASSSTVRDEDVKTVLTHLEDFDEETGSPVFNEGQKWYYLSGADSDEAILHQIWDSDALKEGSGVKGGRAVHSAFKDPRTPADAPARWSIEVSALVFQE
ncbi:hypothetical protein GRF29_164g33464 [Pseudopithomyces chartarum]|uniref:Uncharacterized protein n=1 Tax=Pseudopithomyces chartarum TaxID=1892770 RepID=A0AAN6RC55_9PLEO|nr:hypothetical protein GRF29_164g33464 [Pseudopithomyces chartarum]